MSTLLHPSLFWPSNQQQAQTPPQQVGDYHPLGMEVGVAAREALQRPGRHLAPSLIGTSERTGRLQRAPTPVTA